MKREEPKTKTKARTEVSEMSSSSRTPGYPKTRRQLGTDWACYGSIATSRDHLDACTETDTSTGLRSKDLALKVDDPYVSKIFNSLTRMAPKRFGKARPPIFSTLIWYKFAKSCMM